MHEEISDSLSSRCFFKLLNDEVFVHVEMVNNLHVHNFYGPYLRHRFQEH